MFGTATVVGVGFSMAIFLVTSGMGIEFVIYRAKVLGRVITFSGIVIIVATFVYTGYWL